MRRRRLVGGQRGPRLLTVILIGVLLLTAGGYGLSHGRSAADQTGDQAGTATAPVAAFAVTPPMTPLASPQATPRATPATPAAASLPACAGAHVHAVATVPQGDAGPGPADVVVATLNLRTGPSTQCPIRATLSQGTQVTIHSGLLTNDGYDWRHVTTPQGDGYTVASAYQHVAASKPTFVEILMYHHIEAGTDNLHVPPEQFAQQVKWLKDNGYVSITPDDLSKALYHGGHLPAKPIMLTIDDGNPSTMTFKAILDQYGFRGVYFLPNYAHQTPAQIKALDQSGQVCAHTVSHPFLDTLSAADQDWQITSNQQWLAKIVGHPIDCFAYPFGRFNDDTTAILKQDGFTIAFNAWGGGCRLSKADDPYHLTRKEIDPVFDLATFAQIVTQGW